MSSTPSAHLFKPLQDGDPVDVGGYRLAAVLGTGGMGKVYLSYTPGGRPLALKVIRPEFSEDPEFRRRFKQEVHAAQRVQGLYTAPVIDFDTDGPQPWLATAYVPGPSLAHAVAQHGGLPVRSVLLLTVGVAEALNVIHGAGVVHRDLKPANVLLASDGPRVIDFGIARAADTTALTGTGVSVGTPTFMAPEQASAGTVTPATDVFALGQIAAFAAIGAPAYGEGSSHAVLYRIVHEDPDLSRLPEELLPLVTRCLSRDPAGRPSLTEIIGMCHALSPDALRQGEDWLPQTVAGSITERLRLPEPARTPPPQAPVAPTPTQVSPPNPAPGPVDPYAPTGIATPSTPPPGAPGAPGPVPPPGRPGHPAPGHHTPPPGYPAHPTPAPGPRTPPPVTHGPYGPPVRRKPKRTGLIVAASVVGTLVVLGVIGSLLSDGGGKDEKSGAGTPTSSSSGGSGSEGGAGEGQGRTDPQPVSYKGIDLTDGYQLMLADSPPRPVESEDAAYGGGDLYFSVVNFLDEASIGTDNGKLVLLNNAQKGSLKTCRTETRYTEKIDLQQLTTGSEICVLSKAGHVAVATYRGKSGESDPGSYVTLDLQIWRNAEEGKGD
ncbi:putative serine-threonine protein kinase [Streptomyces ambofaciens ATCC 23877]|uniref:Putative serine-threonine protein kinase n=1 Tax=Streptomyces ambofaciens (strain ATCC 23877 / 3486 / DSM 40053 / JCM 4204 / NBRC 12836 / NRRL B-2516) TaxID=278992 RepID=A3KI63_STRA7|nr:serine/threonine-protein kinase [Streptomyces ambofaciens]AKZ53507.1 putative serine-threonine protein kinase [Streptomyces ambofaciens ATCC 23877]CAJ89391.1 putative serine-threonine protein kinase [Streptomyces ambofaciens ATCC 23877]